MPPEHHAFVERDVPLRRSALRHEAFDDRLHAAFRQLPPFAPPAPAFISSLLRRPAGDTDVSSPPASAALLRCYGQEELPQNRDLATKTTLLLIARRRP